MAVAGAIGFVGIAMGAGAATLVFMSASIPGDFVYVREDLDLGTFALGIVLTGTM